MNRLLTATILLAACSGSAMVQSDGCRRAVHEVVSSSGQTAVLAFLRGSHDSDGPGLINFNQFSDSVCQTAPASANHGALTLVLNSNAPDPLLVYAGLSLIQDDHPLSFDLLPTKTTGGDSTMYSWTSDDRGLRHTFMGLGSQLRFAPRGGTFEDDIIFAATFIRRITFVFDYERP